MVLAMFGKFTKTAIIASYLISISCAPTSENPSIYTQQSIAESQSNRADQIYWASQCTKWDEWDKKGPAYKIYGNSYYVGTCGISAILITGNDGHILIDSGTGNSAAIILHNIQSLGFDPRKVKTILHSHEHHDHVGGFAKIQTATGAKIISSEAARGTLETGKISADDPQFGTHDDMEPVKVDDVIMHDQIITMGSIQITAIETPGHSPGALSWTWQECENGQCLSLVYADSLSPISSDTYRFSDHPQYVSQYRRGLAHIAKLQCDILLTPHPSASQMIDRINRDQNLLHNSDCNGYSHALSMRLNKKIQSENEQK